MNPYVVILEDTQPGPTNGYQYYFFCEADDADHAKEQAHNAYPADLIADVYLGSEAGL